MARAWWRCDGHAGELLRAACKGEREGLRAFLERRIRAEEPAKTAAIEDAKALALAVDQFLFDVANAGKIVMPPDVAHRYRELKRRIDETLADPCSENPVDSRGVSMLVTLCDELDQIRRRFPPPRVPPDIRDLMQARALRMLRGEDVTQGSLERARIATACEWPRL